MKYPLIWSLPTPVTSASIRLPLPYRGSFCSLNKPSMSLPQGLLYSTAIPLNSFSKILASPASSHHLDLSSTRLKSASFASVTLLLFIFWKNVYLHNYELGEWYFSFILVFLGNIYFLMHLITFLFHEFNKRLDFQLYDFQYTSSSIYVRFQIRFLQLTLIHLCQCMFSTARNYHVLTCVVPN